MTTQIHFAGMNTAAFAEALEGHPVLISYADVVRRPGVWKNEILPRLLQNKYPSVILDSGAFTEHKDPSFHVDIINYAEFIRKHSDLFDVVVNLDDINGDVERTIRNGDTLYRATGGEEILPVFHGREAWSVLEGYLNEGHDHIGVGFAREKGRVAKDQGDGATPAEFLREVFQRIAGRATVHGFGMTQFAKEFPFKTVDSTSWISEYLAIKKELEPGVRSHGCTGQLAATVARLSQQQQIKLVVDSYEAAGGEPCPEAISESFWQARTVIRRYSADELAGKLGYSIEPIGEGAEEQFVVTDLRTGSEVARMWTRSSAELVIEDQLAGATRECPHN